MKYKNQTKNISATYRYCDCKRSHFLDPALPFFKKNELKIIMRKEWSKVGGQGLLLKQLNVVLACLKWISKKYCKKTLLESTGDL